jgi:predicted amidohydrolase
MRQAAADGARLVVLPEGHLSGHAKEQVNSWATIDWRAVREELDAIAELAEELRVWVLLGSAHRLTSPHRPHNSMYVIADTGRIVDRYDKRYCSNTELSSYYTPGREPVVFDLDGYRFGIAICIEVNFPDLFEEYQRLGVDCVVLPTYPVDAVFLVKAQALAAIYNCWLAVCAVAQTRHLFASEVFRPDGSSLARVPAGAKVGVADLDRDDPSLSVPLQRARPWRHAHATATSTAGTTCPTRAAATAPAGNRERPPYDVRVATARRPMSVACDRITACRRTWQ